MSYTSLAHIGEMYVLWRQAKGENVTNMTNSACTRLINHDVFYYWLMLPSAGVIGFLMFFVRRVGLCKNCLGGRFAILIPMDFIEGMGYRLSFSAVFGLAASVIIRMIGNALPIHIPGPKFLHIFVKLATMSIYGFAFYPLLAGLSMNTVLSLGLASLYAWVFFIVNVIHATDCVDDWPVAFYMQNVFLQALPELLFSFFLTILLPIRCIQKLIKKLRKRRGITEAEKFYIDSYQAKYVRELFRKAPEWCEDAEKQKLKDKVIHKVKSMTYTRVAGFRYTPRILATYTCGIVILYLVAAQFGSYALAKFNTVVDPIVTLASKNPMPLSEVYYNRTFLHDTRAGLIAVAHTLNAIKISVIVAMTLALLNGVVQIALGLRAYRDGILAAWRGDYSDVGERRGYASLMVGFVRYSGYQVAYIFWAFMLQFGVLSILLIALAVFIILLVFWKLHVIINLIWHYWPVIAISLAINILSKVAAHFVFLQDRGKSFGIENRRLLFCVMYFLFFYNVFVGMISCILRMVKALVFGLMFLSRLDSSTLPKKFEQIDPGFKSWVGLIHVENAHTNPVLITFVNMVKDEIQRQRDEKDKKNEEVKVMYSNQVGDVSNGVELRRFENGVYDESKGEAEKKAMQRRKAMKAQWFLAYTLMNNLPLRATRKHYMDARKERIQRRFMKKNGEEEDVAELEKNGVDEVETKPTKGLHNDAFV